MANEESSAPFIPYYNFAPENFRKIINRQIQNQVLQSEENAKFNKGDADGRFGSSVPARTIQVRNDLGYFYFVVGFSTVGDLSVAAE